MKYGKDLYSAIGEAILKNHSIVDADGNYKLLSQTIRERSGYNAEELATANFKQFIHEDDLPIILEQLSTLPAGEMVIFNPFRFRLKSGVYTWLEASVTSLLHDPNIEGYLINSRNVTKIIEENHIRNKITTSYSNFFAKHPFGVVHMTIDGKVDMINPQLSKDLGYSIHTIQSRPLISFFLPQYQKKVFLMLHKARLHGEAETFDVEVYTMAGGAMHVNLTIVPVVYQGETIEIYAVIKDISDRYTLQQSLQRTSIVADKTTNGVVVGNALGQIEWVNNGFTQMNGYTLAEAVGKRPGDLLRSNGTPELRKLMMEQLNKGQPYHKEIRCLKKDDTPYWNLVDITPVLDKNHKLERTISIHIDITERKKAEQELNLFAQDLYKRNKELQQFGYIVSHNLRSPVANIMGIANILEMDKGNPETVDICTHNLQTAVNSLDAVIRDLSKILSSADASAEMEKEHVDLTALLRSVKADLRNMVKFSGAKIIIPEQPIIIYTHKAYLYSIFYNLISNAIKYKSGQSPEIKVNVAAHQEYITVYVADNGIGIDLNRYKEELFKPYRRFNVNVEGKGLGLFLVKSHIEALNGTIDVESEPGKGTTFILELPTQKAEVSKLEAHYA